MTRPNFIAVQARVTLQRHQWDNFDALWQANGEQVEEPSVGRDGFNNVTRLALEDIETRLLRQSATTIASQNRRKELR